MARTGLNGARAPISQGGKHDGHSLVGKRFLLAVVSLLGAISFSAQSGTPLDINLVSSILQIAFEAFAAFFAAHGSYSLLTGKTAPTELPNA
jgi:hypothetical protein